VWHAHQLGKQNMMQSSHQGQKQKEDSQTAFYIQQIHTEQKRIANRALLDDKMWSHFILVVAILGVSFLLLGVVSSVLGLTSIGYTEVAAGTITSGISILVHRPRRDIMQRADKIYDKQAIEENLHIAIMLAESLHEEARERATETIIKALADVQSKVREAPELPVGRQSDEKIPQLPTNEATNTHT
jgi:hypothetical protein